MRRAMAAEAEALREAKAKFIQADGEKQAAINITDAAHLMASNPQSLQLR
jgi:erythrocyte band 7 integral membrane protein